MKAVLVFLKNFFTGAALGWFIADMAYLFMGDMRPLWRKGVDVEWLVNTQQDEQEKDRLTFLGFRVTYTYSEPVLLKPED